jgi:hypothetical protein
MQISFVTVLAKSWEDTFDRMSAHPAIVELLFAAQAPSPFQPQTELSRSMQLFKHCQLWHSPEAVNYRQFLVV